MCFPIGPQEYALPIPSFLQPIPLLLISLKRKHANEMLKDVVADQ
jgi:hypothetical protein